jgi:hypothetical protein
VCRIDRLFIPNSLQLVGHPEVHVVHKLPNGVWKVVDPTAGKFELDIFDTGQGVGVRAVAIQKFDQCAVRHFEDLESQVLNIEQWSATLP